MQNVCTEPPGFRPPSACKFGRFLIRGVPNWIRVARATPSRVLDGSGDVLETMTVSRRSGETSPAPSASPATRCGLTRPSGKLPRRIAGTLARDLCSGRPGTTGREEMIVSSCFCCEIVRLLRFFAGGSGSPARRAASAELPGGETGPHPGVHRPARSLHRHLWVFDPELVRVQRCESQHEQRQNHESNRADVNAALESGSKVRSLVQNSYIRFRLSVVRPGSHFGGWRRGAGGNPGHLPGRLRRRPDRPGSCPAPTTPNGRRSDRQCG